MKAVKHQWSIKVLPLLACCAFSIICPAQYKIAEFAEPPMQWRPVPLWFWNNTSVEPGEVESQLEQMILTDKYGGCAIVPFGENFSPGYLSDEYFALYRKAAETARKYGATMSLYDEYGFPSGSMGAINGSGVTTFKNNHPDHTIKRLDKHEFQTFAGDRFICQLNSDRIMSIVAMEKVSHEIISLRDKINNNTLEWVVPENGEWTVMLFTCVTDGDPNVDYLSPESVQLFINDTHQAYYTHFPEVFGNTISTTFFDEPTMYRAEGRMWTSDFNEKFQNEYGYSPEILYPALWYDIGSRTSAARNLLFGFRSRLYAEGFMKTISGWALTHGILSTGHQDQEEVVNPVSVSGDLMLVGKYMDIPGIDKIGGDRPAEHFYKVVSSSANNWDKTYVMSETFGAMGNIPIEQMYRITTEQYTKGINKLIPHAVWYNDSNVTFLPELSWRNPLYNKYLPDFNSFLARLNYILARPGRHVADVAVLYPINTLQAGHYLDGPKGYYQGGVDVPGVDYNEVSRILTDELGIDFTYLHPDVIDDRCRIDGSKMVMDNPVNRESFSVIVIPGVKALTTSNLAKLKKAYQAGCTVIFTSQLPTQCADFDGCDNDVITTVRRMLSGENGRGQAIFVENPTAEALGAALDSQNLDIRFTPDSHPFNYIHKVIDGKDVYYFGNIDTNTSSCTVSIRGSLKKFSLLTPRSGSTTAAHLARHKGRSAITLTLEPGESVFLINNSLIDFN